MSLIYEGEERRIDAFLKDFNKLQALLNEMSRQKEKIRELDKRGWEAWERNRILCEKVGAAKLKLAADYPNVFPLSKDAKFVDGGRKVTGTSFLSRGEYERHFPEKYKSKFPELFVNDVKEDVKGDK